MRIGAAGQLFIALAVLMAASGCNAGTGEGRPAADESRADVERPAAPTPIGERPQQLDTGEAEAEAAIVTFARQVLGITVDPIYAGSVTREVSRALDVSAAGEAATESVADLAVVSYGAVFPNGAASLSYGEGTISGDLSVDINTSSLGAYSLLAGGPVPVSEAEALGIVLGVFPGLGNRTFSATVAPDGFAWRYEGQTNGFDPETFQATLVAEVVQIGLIAGRGPGGGQAMAYALVGRGHFASDLRP